MAFFKKQNKTGALVVQHTVLLVDDEPDNLGVLDAILGEHYHVLQADDGQSALDLVRGMAHPERLALLISDQRMPRMTGVQLCEQMRVVSPNTVCIIVTGYSDVDAIVDSINRTRIFQFVIKPFDRYDFELIVKRALEAYDMRQKLDDYVQNLERRVEERTQELQLRNTELSAAYAIADGAHREAAAALDALKKSKVQLVRSEKMAALGQLVAGVAHEINTPIGVGVTAASTLEGRSQELAKQLKNGLMKKSDLSEYLETAEAATGMILEHLQRASDLVETFKGIAVENSSECRARFDLKDWLEETMDGLGWRLAPLGIGYAITCAPGLEVLSYSEALFDVINNLLGNVLAHAYPAGRGGMIKIAAERQGKHVRLSFGDDGAGIAPSILDKVFDPFFTTNRARGSCGLGLHLVYNIVIGTFKGSIECQSEIGKGCLFVMMLQVED